MDTAVPIAGITKTLRKQLKDEQRRTKTTARMLFGTDENLPKGLTPGVVNRWISGLITTAPQSHVEYVLRAWQSLPYNHGLTVPGSNTHGKGRRIPKPGEHWVQITPEMIASLALELKRTGLKISELGAYRERLPAGLSVKTIRNWRSNRVRTAQQEYWDAVMAVLRELPDRR